MAQDLIISRHPKTGLLVRSDGLVHVPKTRGHSGQWTYGWKDDKGYPCISLKGKRKRVHILVAETFIFNPENLPFVDHKNRKRDDNRVENLRFVTPRGNSENSSQTLFRKDYGARECEDPKTYYASYYQANKEHKAKVREERLKALGFVKVPWGKRMVWKKNQEND